jgi:hypothetical protein
LSTTGSPLGLSAHRSSAHAVATSSDTSGIVPAGAYKRRERRLAVGAVNPVVPGSRVRRFLGPTSSGQSQKSASCALVGGFARCLDTASSSFPAAVCARFGAYGLAVACS